MQTKVYDYLIVGTGVVGACIFSDLARCGYRVVAVDKASDVATGASKANSGLVHAGFDPKPNSLKAILNVQGNKMYPSICKRLGIDIKKTGAVVVGTHKSVMQALLQNGKKNGVENLEILDRAQIKELVPNIADNIKYALHAKDAYIVSPYLFTICLCEEAIINGGDLCLEFDLKNVVYKDGVYYVSDGIRTIVAKNIINAAGAGVNDVAKVFGTEKFDILYKRGEYFVLDSTERDLVPLTVFPEPTEHSKGILVTPTIDGNILVGPTSEVGTDETITTAIGLNLIKEKSVTTVNNINFRKTIRIFSGVRSIVGDDFVIEKSKLKPNFINIAGICSPGLSAAPAISLYVLNLLGIKYKVVNDKKIIPYTLLKNLSEKKQNEIILKNPRFGNIVCKCENISEGEIINVLKRPIKIRSIDAVKRRVRAGMGRCQGGFCADKVAKLISEVYKIPLELVLKENRGSYFIYGDIRRGK